MSTKTALKGSYRIRGQEFVGVVTSAKMAKTVTVMWELRKYNRKYERFEKRRTKVHAHNPVEMSAQLGDVVRIKQTRPLSKTKHFVVVEKIRSAKAMAPTQTK